MSNDETRFNELKVQFGAEGRANQLTLTQFASLTDERAGKLADRLQDLPESAEVLEIRKRAIKASQSGKNPNDFICCESIKAHQLSSRVSFINYFTAPVQGI